MLICKQTLQAVAVDPGGDLDKIDRALKQTDATLAYVLLTHGHIDHCGHSREYADRHQVALIGPHEDDAFWIDQLPMQGQRFGFPALKAFKPDRWLKQGDQLTFGKQRLHVHHTPGHTPGHVVFHHMRFDDTNPVKEDQEFVDSILDTVSWLGFSWEHEQEKNLYYASDYFQSLFDCAEYLIKASHAYVDEQSPEDMRARRGSLTEPGEDSPFRDRPAEESLRRFREMRAGKHAEGSMVLRARIDMRSPNLNMRDPALYRIRFAETRHRTVPGHESGVVAHGPKFALDRGQQVGMITPWKVSSTDRAVKKYIAHDR